jgi:hypothetical protein
MAKFLSISKKSTAFSKRLKVSSTRVTDSPEVFSKYFGCNALESGHNLLPTAPASKEHPPPPTLAFSSFLHYNIKLKKKQFKECE